MSVSVSKCPSCGASLPEVEGAASITCRYCATIVRAEAAPIREVAPLAEDVPFARPSAHPLRAVAIWGGLVGLVVVVGGVVSVVRKSSDERSAPPSALGGPRCAPGDPICTSQSVVSVPPIPSASVSAPAPAEPALADLTLEFGDKGTGPGQLEDARAIAVDPSGDVYVADYMSLRVQRFDASGRFLGAFQLKEGDQGTTIHGLAATYDGHLWVARAGDLLELALPDGKIVRTVRNQKPKVSYGSIAVDATNAIYAQNYGIGTYISTDGRMPQSDNLRKLDRNGNVLVAWKGVGAGWGDEVAVDGVGTIFLAERVGRIDVLDAKGNVQARFVSGDHHGGGIAVDGKGHIFFGAFRGIGVCDTGGRRLGTIGTANVRGLAMGKGGRLHAVTYDGHVQVYAVR